MTLNKITDLLPCPTKRGQVDVYVDGELFITVSEDAAIEAGLKKGEQLDADRLAQIEYTVTFTKAKRKAYDYLSYGDLSRNTLCKKLKGYGFEQDVADAVCDDLENAGYINDRRYAVSFASYLANTKLYGPKRIKQELFLKGITGECAENAVSELETDFEQNVRVLANGKFRRDLTDKKEVSKLIAALLRYGYDYDIISSALSCLEEFYE